MQISEVRYEKVKNLGNYESERIGVTIVLNGDEAPESAIERARAFVRKMLEAPDPPRPARPSTQDAHAAVQAYQARQER